LETLGQTCRKNHMSKFLTKKDILDFHENKEASASRIAGMILKRANSTEIDFYNSLYGSLEVCLYEVVESDNSLITTEFFPLVLEKVGKEYAFQFIRCFCKYLNTSHTSDRLTAINFINSLRIFDKKDAVKLATRLFKVVDYSLYPELFEACFTCKLCGEDEKFDELFESILEIATKIHRMSCCCDGGQI
jgi:hypothetical protein